MRILRLTNSDDIRGNLPPAGTVYAMAGKEVTAQTGEPIDWTVRIIWPAPELPDLIDRWIDRYEPDIVHLAVNGYWYIYRSVPLKIQRKLGRAGKPLASVGLRAGGTPWVTRTRAFHWTRNALLTTIGGDTHFEPEEVFQLVESCARRILQHEQITLIIAGSTWPWVSDPTRDLWMYLALKDLAARLHVEFIAVDPRTVDRASVLSMEEADRLHVGLEGRKIQAALEVPGLVSAWRSR